MVKGGATSATKSQRCDQKTKEKQQNDRAIELTKEIEALMHDHDQRNSELDPDATRKATKRSGALISERVQPASIGETSNMNELQTLSNGSQSGKEYVAKVDQIYKDIIAQEQLKFRELCEENDRLRAENGFLLSQIRLWNVRYEDQWLLTYTAKVLLIIVITVMACIVLFYLKMPLRG